MPRIPWRKKKGPVSGPSPPPSNHTAAPANLATPFPSGIRVLHDTPLTSDIDVVFVHGLRGNRDKTWTAKGASDPWPKTHLPRLLPNARILTFGYDAYVSDWKKGVSQNKISDHAWNLLTSLSSHRQEGQENRPIIFVCHSLGGLVCKDALVKSKERLEPHLRNVYNHTLAIAFLGTPHQGSDLSKWAERLLRSISLIEQTNIDIVRVLNKESEVLARIQESFYSIVLERCQNSTQPIHITCFYEELPMRIGYKDQIVVSRTSATLPGYPQIGIHGNHSEMTKFSNAEDPGFKALCGVLSQWTMDARPLRSICETEPCAKSVGGRDMMLSEPLVESHSGTPLSSIFVVPFADNSNFVGRSAILSELRSRLSFTSKEDNSHRRVSLYGLGGVGKTQIALAFIYGLRKTATDVSVLWVYAKSTQSFRRSFCLIADKYKIPGRDDPKTDVLLVVKDWLDTEEHGRWLVVLDNADDEKLFMGPPGFYGQTPDQTSTNLAQYLPHCAHGSVLITTRNKQAAVKLTKGPHFIEVKQMITSESTSLLQINLGDLQTDPGDLDSLSNRLDYLPLALVQAAAFINEHSITVKQYLRLLEESDEVAVELLGEEFETVGREPDTSRAVAETWMISFKQIQQQNPLASDILSIMSFLDRQNIPITILLRYCEKYHDTSVNTVAVTKAFGTLKSFSLITEERDGNYHIHRLVHMVTRSWLNLNGTSTEFRKKALQVVSDVYPRGHFENRDVCSAYLSHALAVLGPGLLDAQAKALLLSNVGLHYYTEGKLNEAENSFREALSIKIQPDESIHPSTFEAMSGLTVTLLDQDRPREAEMLQAKMLKLCKHALGENHPETLIAMGNLASCFQAQKRDKEASELETEVLESMKKMFGDEDLRTLVAMSNLAISFQFQGRLKDAEVLQTNVLRTREDVLGGDHPETLRAMSNLATNFRMQSRWAEAEGLQMKVLELSKKVHGNNHLGTLRATHNLAFNLQHQKRWAEAEKLQVEVVKSIREVLGEKHLMAITATACLAITLQNLNRLNEAEKLQRELLKLMKETLGENHNGTLTVMGELAETLRLQKRWGESNELLRKSRSRKG